MPSRSNSLERARPLLGTLVMIRVEAAADRPALAAAVDQAFAAVERVERRMSFHDSNSDVSHINAAAAGGEISVDPETMRVLSFAFVLGELSRGAFDIAAAPALVRAGFLPARPPRARPGADATFRDLELLDDRRVRWKRKGWIDLGGIAKGYAVDRAVAVLQAQGVAHGVVNAGGDLRCFGRPQPVAVRHPEALAARIPLGKLSNRALATSGGYYSSGADGGRRVEPLVDPKRQACTTWGASVSVAASDCMTADALTKVVRLAPRRTPEILARFHAQAFVLRRNRLRCCGEMILQPETAK